MAVREPARAMASAAPADIHDIRLPQPGEGPPPFALTGAVLLLAVVLGLAYRRAARRRPAVTAVAATSFPDTADDALSRLAEAYRAGTCSGEDVILRLDALLRATLELGAGIPASRLTSAELQGQSAATVDAEAGDLLAGFLTLADRVKFAGQPPAAAAVEQALRAATVLMARVAEGPPA